MGRRVSNPRGQEKNRLPQIVRWQPMCEIKVFENVLEWKTGIFKNAHHN